MPAQQPKRKPPQNNDNKGRSKQQNMYKPTYVCLYYMVDSMCERRQRSTHVLLCVGTPKTPIEIAANECRNAYKFQKQQQH